jgi:2-haloacid dehalogenase
MDLPPRVISAVVFDLGGVLIDWDPRYLYRTLFEDEAAMEDFLATVTTPEWNRAQDAGRPWAEAVEELATRHPERRDLIAAYRERWHEMLGGANEPVVEILEELRGTGVRLFALTNWSGRRFPSPGRYPFLEWFEGIVVSGDERLIKPDPRIFQAAARALPAGPSGDVRSSTTIRPTSTRPRRWHGRARFVDAGHFGRTSPGWASERLEDASMTLIARSPIASPARPSAADRGPARPLRRRHRLAQLGRR